MRLSKENFSMRYFIDKIKAYRDDNIEIYSLHESIYINFPKHNIKYFNEQHIFSVSFCIISLEYMIHNPFIVEWFEHDALL